MDLTDLFNPDIATQHPFWIWLTLLAGALWLMGFSRRKILQDLEILGRLEKLDPDNQARPAVKASIAAWVKLTYGWPVLVAVATMLVGALLLAGGLLLAWTAFKLRNPVIAAFAGLALLESAGLLWLAYRRSKKTEKPHIQSLHDWNP